jgi:hypothetical protein
MDCYCNVCKITLGTLVYFQCPKCPKFQEVPTVFYCTVCINDTKNDTKNNCHECNVKKEVIYSVMN